LNLIKLVKVREKMIMETKEDNIKFGGSDENKCCKWDIKTKTI